MQLVLPDQALCAQVQALFKRLTGCLAGDDRNGIVRKRLPRFNTPNLFEQYFLLESNTCHRARRFPERPIQVSEMVSHGVCASAPSAQLLSALCQRCSREALWCFRGVVAACVTH